MLRDCEVQTPFWRDWLCTSAHILGDYLDMQKKDMLAFMLQCHVLLHVLWQEGRKGLSVPSLDPTTIHIKDSRAKI